MQIEQHAQPNQEASEIVEPHSQAEPEVQPVEPATEHFEPLPTCVAKQTEFIFIEANENDPSAVEDERTIEIDTTLVKNIWAYINPH